MFDASKLNMRKFKDRSATWGLRWIVEYEYCGYFLKIDTTFEPDLFSAKAFRGDAECLTIEFYKDLDQRDKIIYTLEAAPCVLPLRRNKIDSFCEKLYIAKDLGDYVCENFSSLQRGIIPQ